MQDSHDAFARERRSFGTFPAVLRSGFQKYESYQPADTIILARGTLLCDCRPDAERPYTVDPRVEKNSQAEAVNVF